MKEAVQLFSEKMAAQGKELHILIDEQALNAEKKADAEVPSETKVNFPDHPKKMPISTALGLALNQVQNGNATYLIRKGTVIITTKGKASIKSLLCEKVVTQFHQRPLAEALYHLADITGASILLDPRATDKLLTPVSATFPNGASLESAVILLADMAGLKMIVVGEAIYVTTPENAASLSKGKKE